MANCKFCGKAVEASPVMHKECWEAECEKVAEIFCDRYCRWPFELEQDELDEKCDSCDLVKLLNLGGATNG